MEPYVFMWCRIFLEGSSLNIEIHKHFIRPRVFRSKQALQDDLLCQANISMESPGLRSTARNQLWVDLCVDHFSLTQGNLANLQVEFTSSISGLQFWIVAEACILSLWMWIPYWNFIIGLRRFTRSEHPNQGNSRKAEILQTTFEPPWSCERWCWDAYRVRVGHH